MPRPQLLIGGSVLGTGNFTTVGQFQGLLAVMEKHGITRIDTAARYPSANPGRSEGLLGEAFQDGVSDGLAVDTKILATTFGGEGSLAPAAIEASITQSRARLIGQPINVLYCHVFDPVTPVGDSVRAIAELQKKGWVRDVGVSNFTAAQVDAFAEASGKEDGGAKPKCFEGLYNALSRGPESSGGLLDTVRKHGMSFVAYSPLAGGFLTGKLSAGVVEGTRFAKPVGKMYRDMYDRLEMHKAIEMLQKACSDKQEELSGHDEGEQAVPALAAASLRWLYWHSALGENDGIILGGSSPEVIDANCNAIERGPLPDELVRAFDEAWEMVKDVAPTI